MAHRNTLAILAALIAAARWELTPRRRRYTHAHTIGGSLTLAADTPADTLPHGVDTDFTRS